MSFQRRTALLDFARAHNAFIFEDDYDAEFRFIGPPLPSLQGIDNASRVIYAGTVSKILCPGFASGLHRRTRTAGRFVSQNPQCDGSTLVSHRPGDTGAFHY